MSDLFESEILGFSKVNEKEWKVTAGDAQVEISFKRNNDGVFIADSECRVNAIGFGLSHGLPMCNIIFDTLGTHSCMCDGIPLAIIPGDLDDLTDTYISKYNTSRDICSLLAEEDVGTIGGLTSEIY